MLSAGMVSDVKDIVKRVNKPVTVKTRLGWDENSIKIEEVAMRLQDVGVKALTIHGRTRKQMYKGEANWSLIAKVKENPNIHIPIFGNGDINSPQKALVYKNKYGIDGIMIGRAAIGYPWIFNEIKHFMATGYELEPPSISERVEVAKKHLKFSLEWKGEKLGVFEMRRHYTNYFKRIPDFKSYRTRLVETEDSELLLDILDEIKYQFSEIPLI